MKTGDETRKRLILTVGLPRSGKSTWAREQDFPIVCPDAIRIAIHGKPFIQEAEDLVWAAAFIMARALFIAGHHTVIVDATNNTAKRRDRWTRTFSDCDVKFKYFDASVELCNKRAIDTGRPHLLPIIERMAMQADWADLAETDFNAYKSMPGNTAS